MFTFQSVQKPHSHGRKFWKNINFLEINCHFKKNSIINCTFSFYWCILKSFLITNLFFHIKPLKRRQARKAQTLFYLRCLLLKCTESPCLSRCCDMFQKELVWRLLVMLKLDLVSSSCHFCCNICCWMDGVEQLELKCLHRSMHFCRNALTVWCWIIRSCL